MKRTMSVLILVVMLIGIMMPVAAFAMPKEDLRYVKTGNGKPLNVRSGPGTNFSVETTLPYRTEVIVDQTNGDWCLIHPLNIEWSNPMWVMKSFLVTKDPGPYAGPVGPTYEDVDAAVRLLKPLEQPYLAEIVTERPNNLVHLRWIPNTSARYSAQYLAGEQILVLAESQYWAQVLDLQDGLVGFVLKKNVNPMMELQEELMQQVQQLLDTFDMLGQNAEAVGAAQ